MVFTIKRFSLDDGPGIRTTVFLKGCPLRCIWCHSPLSVTEAPDVVHNPSLCTKCGKCADVCPGEAIRISDGGHVIDAAKCSGCGLCEQACPRGALRLWGRSTRVDELLEKVLEDHRFYQKGGGGITVSGGEPMRQIGFLCSLLKLAKEQGNLTTCLDTSGYAPWSDFEKVLPYVDIFLFDIKELDPGKHVEFTGVSNELILSNLNLLDKNGARIIIRCPIVPTKNLTTEHIAGIARLYRSLKNAERCELLKYHRMACDDWAQARVDPRHEMAQVPPLEEPEARRLLEELESLGVSSVAIP